MTIVKTEDGEEDVFCRDRCLRKARVAPRRERDSPRSGFSRQPRRGAVLPLQACVGCLLLSRVVAILLPVTYKRMIDELAAVTKNQAAGSQDQTTFATAVLHVWVRA